jgi:hypothetical protein
MFAISAYEDVIDFRVYSSVYCLEKKVQSISL